MKIVRLNLGILFSLMVVTFISLTLYDKNISLLHSSKKGEKILYMVDGIKNFVNQYYQEFIPYEVTKKRVVIDRTQDVRNIATMYDIMQLQLHFYPGKKSMQGINLQVMRKIHENAEFYLEIYKKNSLAMRQASAFLALLLSMISKEQYENDIKQITDFLYEQINDLEEQFELGEVLMALSVLDPKPNVLNNQIDKIVKNIKNHTSEIDHIFQYNWLAKFILAYKNDYSRTLFTILHEKVREVMRLFTHQEETNYLAVAYECLASLRSYDSTIEVTDLIESVTSKLFERYDPEYGLFKFKNGGMRLDITGHIVNGFIHINSSF